MSQDVALSCRTSCQLHVNLQPCCSAGVLGPCLRQQWETYVSAPPTTGASRNCPADSHSDPMDPESCQVWYVPSGALRETGASGRKLQPLQPDTPQCSTASKPWEVVARARSDDEARIAPHSQSVLQIIRYEFHMIHCEKQLTPATCTST